MNGVRAVLDTNIWISYAVSGRLTEIATWIIYEKCTIFTSKLLIDEIVDVYSRSKFKKFHQNISPQELLNFHLQTCETISIIDRFADSPDPKDNFLFDLGMQADADFVVTGDQLLLKYNFQPVHFISLHDFQEIMNKF